MQKKRTGIGPIVPEIQTPTEHRQYYRITSLCLIQNVLHWVKMRKCVYIQRLLVWFVLLDLQIQVYDQQIVVCPFLICLFAIVLSVFLRFTDSDYPFGIFKLFLHKASPWQRFDLDNAVNLACDLFECISYTREPYSYNSVSNNPITVLPGLRCHLQGKVKDR